MSANRRLRPPWLAERLLRACVSREEVGFVVGDMREELEHREEAVGRRAARRWYWAESMKSCGPLVAQRWRAARRRRSMLSHGDPMLQTLFGDARYSLRLARRSPLASLAIIATMVLGVGSTTAVFSAINAVLLRPLPFPESDRVVQIEAVIRDGRAIGSVAYPDAQDFRKSVPELAELTVLQQNDLTLQHGTDPRLVHVVSVDDSYPRVFGTRAALGRLFTPGDMTVNAANVVLLSYDFWNSEFGGDATIVGRTITLNDESVQVVGVLARDAYTYPNPTAEALMPLVIQPNSPMTNRGSMWATAVGRLRPGASLDRARAGLRSVAQTITKEFPNSNSGISVRATPLRESVVGPVVQMLELLAAAVAAVLLVACVNIGNLILGRAQVRSREFAVRAAIGGSPGRVRAQIVTESVMLAVIGGVIGAALSPIMVRALVAIYPDALPRATEIGVDTRVLAFAAGVTLLAGILAALPTARRAARLDLARDLRDAGRTVSDRGDRRVGGALIALQVAASLVLLFSAGLLLQTFAKLTRLKPGFDADHAVTFHVYASSARYKKASDIARYYAEATDALRRIPGVTDASSGTLLPFSGTHFFDTYIQDEKGDQGPNNPAAAVSTIDAGYDRAMRIPLLRGRSFTEADDSSAAQVVMINEAIAKRRYPGENPVGRFIQWNGQGKWEIIGVLGTVKQDQLSEEDLPILYTPVRQAPRRGRFFVIRSSRPAAQILAEARAALRSVDPTIALTGPATMADRIAGSLGPQRFRAALMMAIGALALGLAVIGIYGVVAYAVTRRVREIGIRMALGESARAVRRRVILDALRVAATGLLVGVVLSLLAGRWLAVFLVQVNPFDGRLLGAAIGLLIAVVMAAASGPAWRAARVDPMTALRAD